MDCLSPVAALAAVIKHQAGSTMLDVGSSLVALIEFILAGWVRVDTIRLACAETRSCAAAATAAATTARLGLSMGGWCDWRQGVRTRSAG